MAEKTTSAGQLYEILSQAFFDGEESKASIHTWHDTLRAKNVNNLDVTKKLGELFSLFGYVRQELLLLDEPYCNHANDALSRIQSQIIIHGLTTKWSEIKSRIIESDLSLLKMCDGLLISQGICQNSLQKDKVGELLEQVNELISEFRGSELPSELKSELIRELIKIQTALYDFDIKGEANLQQVCNVVLGDITTKSIQNPKLYRKFIKPVQKVVNTVVMIGGLMTTADLSIKYKPVLATQIVNFIESLPVETTIDQPLLEGTTQPQQMEANIDAEVNHKVFIASGEEE